MKRVRQIIFWSHLIAGVTAGLVILIMSVTGVLLTYERQLLAWVETRGYRRPPPASGEGRLRVEALLDRARQVEGQNMPVTLTLRADPEAPAAVGYNGGRTLYFDPYTGELLGEGSTRVRSLFRLITDWHRWLGRRTEAGRAVTGAANLLFLLTVVSGFYIWWPRKLAWSQFRNALWFRRGMRGKVRDFNWHNVIGFWCVAPLFVIVLSGVVISYPWAGNLVYRLAGEMPPTPRPALAPGKAEIVGLDGLDRWWARAEGQTAGWQSISLRLPATSGAPLVFTIDRGDGGQPQKRAQLTLDGKTGEFVRWEPFSSYSTGRQWRSILRFAHTGEVGGLIGQTIAGIASGGAAVLVWTGLSLALARWRAYRAGRARALAPVTARLATESEAES